MKKITDEMRLNWVIKHLSGSRIGKKPWLFALEMPALDGWNGINTLTHMRKQIDEGIRLDRRKK